MTEHNQSALEKVQQAIEKYSDLKILTFKDNTATSELAAKALGVAVGQIAKSLCFVSKEQAFLIVCAGDKKIDSKKLAKTLGAKKIKFASSDTVLELTGFTPGGVCPFALKTDIPIYTDESLFEYNVVYVAAGTDNSALPIHPKKLQEITGANRIDATIK